MTKTGLPCAFLMAATISLPEASVGFPADMVMQRPPTLLATRSTTLRAVESPSVTTMTFWSDSDAAHPDTSFKKHLTEPTVFTSRG